MPRVTARDVAREAGVSQATVSFVLNDRADQSISEGTRTAVLAAVQKLGYIPSGAARSLRRGRGNVVLCVIPDFPVAQAMEEFKLVLGRILGEAGYACVFLHTEAAAQPLSQLWPHVDPAVVVSFGQLRAEDAESIQRAGIALIDGVFGPAGGAVTGLDQAEIGRMQVRHLVQVGHARIGYGAVEDDRERAFCAPRVRGAKEACRELGVPAPTVLPLEYSRESARGALLRWTTGPSPVTAVATFNDLAATAVLAAAVDEGVAVPDDLAIIGVDNLTVSALTTPTLSTLAINLAVSAHTLAAHVLDEAGATGPRPEPTNEPVLTLLHRETT